MCYPYISFSVKREKVGEEKEGESITQGSCAKMFTIAGPVIVYGVSTSVIYGIIFVLLQSF